MMFERIISTLKRDPHYKWESTYSWRELLTIALERGMQLLRGLPLRVVMKQSAGFVFRGRNVIIRHAYNVSSGRNLILDDNVCLNGLSYNGIRLGNDVTIGRDSIFVGTGIIAQKGVGIKIGNGVGINARAFLGGQGGIEIGDNVIIGPDVKIFSENHNFRADNQPIKKQGVSRKGVWIKANCWVGSGVIIVDGVTIGEGCVVAAGSVVTKSLPDNVVAAGIPARVVGPRVSVTLDYQP